MAVSKRLRYEVLRRDNHTCRYCGESAPEVRITVDHVVPIALGGSDEPSNLVAACADCNAGKSSSNPDAPLVDDVDQRYVRWRDAMMFAFEVDMELRKSRDARRAAFLSAWNNWTYESQGKRHTIDLPIDWHQTVDRFLTSGLMIEDLHEAIDQTMCRRGIRDEFSYFCGVCWNLIKERQEFAVAYLEEPTDGS